MTRTALPTNFDLEEDMKVFRSMSRGNKALAPNMNKIVEFTIVGSADDSYVNPRNIEEAWNHQDEYERSMWRNAIKKKFNDLVKHKVLEKVKKIEIPYNRKIWEFKKPS